MHNGERGSELWLDWESNEQGKFALERQKRLLLHLASPWRRRGQLLLEIECHDGYFLDGFWESGFDVTGVDRSPLLVNKARFRLGKKADLHLGHPENLSFEDRSFDYVLAVSALEKPVDAEKVIQEAARICKKELLLGFFNRCSCAYFGQFIQEKLKAGKAVPRGGAWRSAAETRRLIHRNLGRVQMEWASILLGPKLTWRRKYLAERMNDLVLPFPIGTFCAMRIDLTWQKTGTPLMAWNPSKPKASQGAQPTSHRPAI